MSAREITNTLEKQVQLLSEHSQRKDVSAQELAALTRAMNESVSLILAGPIRGM